ncbi:MAG: CpsB/CapC family capsule biosynthesis tyrosine phosphatase [Candidatus Izemoplasmatales bacterium]|jgi:protein-tyrosine phosphatase
MIDIHTHVLPFVDDGSPNIEASLKMVETAALAGVTDLFLTPHYMRLRNYLSKYQQNKVIFDTFVTEVKKAGYPIRLHLGNEIYYTIATVKDLQNQIVVPLGDTNIVLLEFAMGEVEEEDIAEAIYNMKTIGYQAVIAHPERYDYVKYADYKTIHEMGGLIQINATAILGKYGFSVQKMVLRLIKEGLVDFVASDSHNFRSYGLKEAFTMIEKKFGIIVAHKIFANELAINRQ